MDHRRKACSDNLLPTTDHLGVAVPEELALPAGARADPAAFEILRLWATHGRLAMSVRGDVEGDAEDFGMLLADLFSHACCRYAQKSGRSLMECREDMLLGFLQQARARVRSGGAADSRGH